MFQCNVTERFREESSEGKFGNSSWSAGPKAWHCHLALLAWVTRQISLDGFLSASLCSPACLKYTEAGSVPTHLPGPPRPAHSHFSHRCPWSPKAVPTIGPCCSQAFAHHICRHNKGNRSEPGSPASLGCLPKYQPKGPRALGSRCPSHEIKC